MSQDAVADAPVQNPAHSDHDAGVAPANLGLRHVALWVEDGRFEATVRFYRECLQLAVVWQPDADNVYLGTPIRGASPSPASAGSGGAPTGMGVPVADNLAIHRRTSEVEHERGALDHLGFCMPDAEAVEAWERRILSASERYGVRITQPFKRHRDGSSSFYFRDPAGHLVQLIHVPNIRG